MQGVTRGLWPFSAEQSGLSQYLSAIGCLCRLSAIIASFSIERAREHCAENDGAGIMSVK